MTLNEKTSLINRIASLPCGYVTLEGRPALITALASDFLTVVTLTAERLNHEYSWECVDRVIAKNGAFKS